MAYDDYNAQPELSPLDLASQMTGQALGLPENVFRTYLFGAGAYHMAKQAAALRNLARGEGVYKGLPQHMGLGTLLGRGLGKGKLGTIGGGMRGAAVGGLLGMALGANPIAAAAIGIGTSILPRVIAGSKVTKTGVSGVMEAMGIQSTSKVGTMVDKALHGHTFNLRAKENLTAEYMQRYAEKVHAADIQLELPTTYSPHMAAAERAKTADLYKMMTKSPKEFEEYLHTAGRAFLDQGTNLKSFAGDLMSDVTRTYKPTVVGDIKELFNRGITRDVNQALQAATSAPGLLRAMPIMKPNRAAAAGRLGIRGASIAAAGGIALMAGSAIVSQVSRGAQVLRDNLRDMNTALRLTEFGGRGSFMNDVVNTERDRAISAMQFVRSGRDFIGLEARLLAEGFNG